jgi:glutaredoxin 3
MSAPSPTLRHPSRCAIHGLVTASDGQCVICRRAESGTRSDGGRFALAALGVLLALVVGAIVYKRRPGIAPVAIAPESAAVSPPSIENEPQGPMAKAPVLLPISRRGPAAGARPDASRQLPQPAASSRAGDPLPEASVAARQRDLEAAMRQVPIRMYTTSWCPVCTKAKIWMTANRIAFAEFDVEASDANRRAQRALNPQGGVPTIDVDGEVLVGFGPSSIESAIRHAAERRLDR